MDPLFKLADPYRPLHQFRSHARNETVMTERWSPRGEYPRVRRF